MKFDRVESCEHEKRESVILFFSLMPAWFFHLHTLVQFLDIQPKSALHEGSSSTLNSVDQIAPRPADRASS